MSLRLGLGLGIGGVSPRPLSTQDISAVWIDPSAFNLSGALQGRSSTVINGPKSAMSLSGASNPVGTLIASPSGAFSAYVAASKGDYLNQPDFDSQGEWLVAANTSATFNPGSVDLTTTTSFGYIYDDFTAMPAGPLYFEITVTALNTLVRLDADGGGQFAALPATTTGTSRTILEKPSVTTRVRVALTNSTYSATVDSVRVIPIPTPLLVAPSDGARPTVSAGADAIVWPSTASMSAPLTSSGTIIIVTDAGVRIQTVGSAGATSIVGDDSDQNVTGLLFTPRLISQQQAADYVAGL